MTTNNDNYIGDEQADTRPGAVENEEPLPPNIVRLSFFRDVFARDCDEVEGSLAELAELIQVPKAPAKDELPLIKLAQFDGDPSENGSLRYDEAISELWGVEGDYDRGEVPIEEAAERLRAAGIETLLHETPSSMPEQPRWRALCWVSQGYAGDTAELRELRARWVARINGVLGGILAGESFTLSQPYFIGGIEGKPPIKVFTTAGSRIDLRDDLDAGAIHENRQGSSGKRSERTQRDERDPAQSDPDPCESDDDPKLLEECRQRVVRFRNKHGIGTQTRGRRVHQLIQWLGDIGTKDGLTPSARMIEEAIEEDYPETTVSAIRSMLSSRQNPRGCTVIDGDWDGEGDDAAEAPEPPPAPLTVAEAKQKLEEELSKVLTSVWPVQRLIKGAMGLGKTTTVLRLIAEIEDREISKGQIVYVAQRHELLEDAAEELRKHLRACGWSADEIEANAVILRGRDHVGRDRNGKEKPALCLRPREAAMVAKHGGSSSQSLCKQPATEKRPEILCPLWNVCPFQEMKRRSARARFVFMTHSHLASQWPPFNARGVFHPYNAKLIIVDEDPASSLLDSEATEIKVGTFAELLPGLGATIEAALARPDALDVLGEVGITPKQLRDAADKRQSKEQSRPMGNPAMTEEARASVIAKAAKSPPKAQIARWLRCLADELESGRTDKCLSMRLVTKVEGEAKTTVIKAHARKQLWDTSRQSWLILDGTAAVEKLRCFLPKIAERQIEVERNVIFVQVTHSTYSKASTIKDGKPTELLETACKFVELLARAYPDRVAVFTTKAQRKAMTEGDAKGTFEPFRGARLGHYGNLRGSNDFQDCEIGVPTGRPERYLDLIEDEVGAWYYDSPEPIHFIQPDKHGNRRLASRTAVYTMRDGTRDQEGKATYHPDRRAQMWLAESREAEMMQAIDRLRLIHNTKPKLIFILSSVPLPIPVDALITEEDIARIVEFAELLAQVDARGAMLLTTATQLTPEHLHATWPERWPSPESAKYLLSKILPSNIKEFLKVSCDPLGLIDKIYRANNSHETLKNCLLRLVLDQAGWDLAQFRQAGTKAAEWSAFAYRAGADPACTAASLAVALGTAPAVLELRHLDGTPFVPGGTGDARLDQALALCRDAGMALPLDPAALAALPGSPWPDAKAAKNWASRAGAPILQAGPPSGWNPVEYRLASRRGGRISFSRC